MTPRQQAFAAQYALDHNGTAAAVRAGYAEVGAHVTASRLLRKPKVAAVVAAHEADAAERLGLTREKVLEGLRDALEMARQQNNPVAMARLSGKPRRSPATTPPSARRSKSVSTANGCRRRSPRCPTPSYWRSQNCRTRLLALSSRPANG